MKKATIGLRLVAMIVDSLILAVLYPLICAITGDWTARSVIELLCYFLYYALLEGSMGATLGKKLCKITVVNLDGTKIKMGTAFMRSFGRLVSGLVLGIGYIIALFNENGRSLHDMIANTIVIDERSLYMPVSAPAPVAAPTVRQQGAAQLVGVSGQFAGKAFNIPAAGITIGRDAATNDIVFPENVKGISRNHCKLQFNAQTGMFVLNDLGSSYGTFKGDGEKIDQGQTVALNAGDEFYLATKANLFRVSL